MESWSLLDDWGAYYVGLSSMPQLVIDGSNNIFLVYSAVTELYDNGIQNYRHLWARGFSQASQSWGIFRDLTSGLIFIFSECVFPSCSPTSDDKIHLVFQEDSEPGLAVKGDEDPFGENYIRYLNVDKSDLITIVTGSGHLSGTVTMLGSGNPLYGATISLQGISYSTTSSANGTYTINDIPVGTYTAICSKNGFATAYEVVEIVEDMTTYQNFQLEEINTPTEGIIGETFYDLQSNSSMQNRIYKYDDGTIGAVYTLGFDYPNFSGDRGTGYNYFDGLDWGPMPVERIENDRTGWPSYTPWGLNGEIVVAHYSGASSDGLIINYRENKGNGEWNFNEFFGPTYNNYYLWPRAMAGGFDHNDLHVIALTAPEANGGITYQGMDGALLYSRSPDGGATWDHEHILLDEINSNYYNGFDGDSYEIQTQGENVAFLVGDAWTDLVLMKSTDNGDTWTKTIIWEHPYPLWSNTPTDTFYCVDGAHSLAFDLSGKVHVAFGINRAISEDGSMQSWFPAVDGIGYWNEDMPIFSNNLNALNPYGGAGTELIEDYNLIGWTQDINGNGELDVLDDWGTYYLGFSSMPQLVIDETNSIFLIYSSVTETYDNG
ncbi:MAG: carboxypeptidase-like regulatory domain-containing protein, partial [Bacteroidales bacterium]